MMRPDVKIVIGWSGFYQRKVAKMLYKKLKAYSESDYPINVSLIDDDTMHTIDIAEKMTSEFSDCDYAFFLFDTIGKACSSKKDTICNACTLEEIKDGKCPKDKKCQEVPPLLSVNLLYEYGLAFSSFINRSDKQRIYCFSPSEIDPKSFRYIQGVKLEQYDKFPNDYKDDIEKQTEYIIEHYVYGKILKNLYYGLPKELPLLQKEGEKYIIAKEVNIDDPMKLDKDNTYWADLRHLQPSGIIISLDKQSQPLNDVFIKEYQQFNDTEKSLKRKLLYIVDRAVFIMYLRQENYWDDVVYNGYIDSKNPRKLVKSLLELRLNYLKSNNLDIENDYYIKTINALHGVFLYQKHWRTGKMSENLDKIETFLKPINEIGREIGNRMVYCMATDYLALVYLRKGLHYKAALLFKDVVDCQNNMQNPEVNPNCPMYIWKSYALYNQARCEFTIHSNSLSGKEVSEDEKELSKSWNKDLCEAVESRKQDFEFFGDYPLFPQIITFNMQAEFYHALYEYKLYCLREKRRNPEFEAKDFSADDKLEDWKKGILTVIDVLGVSEKSESVLKEERAYNIQDLVTDKKIANAIISIINKKDKINEGDILSLTKNIYVLPQEEQQNTRELISEILSKILKESNSEILKKISEAEKNIINEVKSVKEITVTNFEYLLKQSTLSQEDIQEAIKELNDQQKTEIMEGVMGFFCAFNDEMDDKLKEIYNDLKETDDVEMKLKLSIPFIKLLGIDMETTFDVKKWVQKKYDKYEWKLFKLMGAL